MQAGKYESDGTHHRTVKDKEVAQQFQEALIRKRAVLEMTGWSNSTLYNRIATGHFKPGVKVGSRMVAWPRSEVEAYIQARIAERDVEIGGAA